MKFLKNVLESRHKSPEKSAAHSPLPDPSHRILSRPSNVPAPPCTSTGPRWHKPVCFHYLRTTQTVNVKNPLQKCFAFYDGKSSLEPCKVFTAQEDRTCFFGNTGKQLNLAVSRLASRFSFVKLFANAFSKDKIQCCTPEKQS